MLTISVNIWANSKKIFAHIDKYCGYNEHIDDLTYIKHPKSEENKRTEDNVA
jgi:hypothetical protein